MTAAPIYAEVDGITAIAVSHRYCFSSKATVRDADHHHGASVTTALEQIATALRHRQPG